MNNNKNYGPAALVMSVLAVFLAIVAIFVSAFVLIQLNRVQTPVQAPQVISIPSTDTPVQPVPTEGTPYEVSMIPNDLCMATPSAEPISLYTYPVGELSNNSYRIDLKYPDARITLIQVEALSFDQHFLFVTISFSSNTPFIKQGWVLAEYMSNAGDIAGCRKIGIDYQYGWLLTDQSQYYCKLVVIIAEKSHKYTLVGKEMKVFADNGFVRQQQYKYFGDYTAADGKKYIRTDVVKLDNGEYREEFALAEDVALGFNYCK